MHFPCRVKNGVFQSWDYLHKRLDMPVRYLIIINLSYNFIWYPLFIDNEFGDNEFNDNEFNDNESNDNEFNNIEFNDNEFNDNRYSNE